MSRSPILESTKYLVLVALSAGPNYGYAIRGHIIGDTLGVYLRDSLLYAVLEAMVRDGLIEERPGITRRQIFQITDLGKRKLEQESRVFKRAARLAQERLGYR